tara:strand:+ start:2266 stop:2775 length:510 start_codon:yes stop_codon:yes gene_type:complete
MSFKHNQLNTINCSIATTYPESIKLIDDLLEDEGADLAGSHFDRCDLNVIDGDELEKSVAKEQIRSNNCSVDIIFVDSSMSFQLIELKFNSTSCSTLDNQNIKDKILGTKSILSATKLGVNSIYYVVFSDGAVNVGMNALYRNSPMLSRRIFKGVTLSQFYDEFCIILI